MGLSLYGLGREVFSEQSTFNPNDPLRDFPRIFLWAWERPEDLRFLDPAQTGVAFLAGTIHLQGKETKVRPRLQPLSVTPGTTLMSVVRLETDHSNKPALGQVQRRAVVSAIARLVQRPTVRAVQIDFDATVSERAFYTDVLRDLRAVLSAGVPLSMTALASWCMGDPWISGLPVDEAVPMLFQMGVDRFDVLQLLRKGGDFTLPVCRQSVGISTNEQLSRLPSGRRVYVFHPQSWSKESASKAIAEVQKWQ